MTALRRARRLSLGVEVALAFCAGVASFVLAAVGIVASGSDAAVIALGVGFGVASVALFRYWGVAYAVPAAVAVLLAFDWYIVPPTHRHSFPESEELAYLLSYLLAGVLIGELAAYANRRAEVSESARSELAEEQAALRRVATLVARESASTEVFAEVAREVGLLLGAERAWMHRYEPDGDTTVVATWGEGETRVEIGTRLDLERDSVVALVRRTGRPARIDDYTNARGSAGTLAPEPGVRSAVSSPIIVGGRLWGAMTAVTLRPEPFPADAESRIHEFTELVATAISNIQARSDLAASRARIVATADEERRRVVRDLHDGAQQRLVHTVVTLKLACRALEDDSGEASPLVAEALRHAEEATAELRELAHGILPSVLTRGGLRAGVRALASRMTVPVEIDVSVDRLPVAVEATAYFIVAEALTNVTKHSQARHAVVSARVTDGTLQIGIRDDGIGGAQPDGSGLLGLGDRLAVLEGSLLVESPPEGGTSIAATIPLP